MHARALAVRCLTALGLVMSLAAVAATGAERVLPPGPAPAPLEYTLDLSEMLPASTAGGEWFQPHPAAIPNPGKTPRVVMVIQKALGSDYFTGLSSLLSDDLGRTWSKPELQAGLDWRDAPNGVKIGVTDFSLNWHAPTRRLIAIGHTGRYTSKGFIGFGHRRDTVWTVFDATTNRWAPWEVLDFPSTPDDRYYFNGVHGHWLVEPDGSLLVPFYFVGPKQGFLLRGAVARLRFDGRKLTYVTHGAELVHPVPRGLYEKSLTWYRGRYYMTIRNDQKGYITTSQDGLNFAPIQPWTFDDGSDLGSYNTHQKWATHSDGLFLVYTRRGANNDHIIRHRAPLFIAQVDPDKLHVIRRTERIAVPERGVSLGNFDATTINEHETWITTAGGPTYLARIRWAKPNQLAGRVH